MSAGVLSLFKEGHKRVIMCAPTGAGKTVTFIDIAHKATLKQTDVLILTDRKALFKQTMGAFRSQGLTPTPLNDKATQTTYNGLVVAMVQTLTSRLTKLKINPKLIIIDEAHEGTFNRVLEAFPDAWVIGVTATPEGKHIEKYYTAISEEVSVGELIGMKPPRLIKPASFQMVDEFKVKTTRGDFDNGEMFTFYDKPELYTGVLEAWKNKAYMKRTICYCVNIEHANKTKEVFGDLARVITSQTSEEEQASILSAHRTGLFPVLINVMIFVKGYDDPSLECVILNFATKSLAKFIQTSGRGGRACEGKRAWTLIDMGGNFMRFGLWQSERKWELKPHRAKLAIGAPPIRKCPACSAMLPMSAPVCEYCDHVFLVKDKEETRGVLREVLEQARVMASQATVGELADAVERGSIKSAFAWRVCRGRGLVREYAKAKGYKGTWVYRQEQNNDKNYKDIFI